MTDNELEIIKYLKQCKADVKNTKAVKLLDEIIDHVSTIVEQKPFTLLSASGNCIICNGWTPRLIRGEYCRVCYDQFID